MVQNIPIQTQTYQPMELEEMEALVRKAQEGCEESKEKMVQNNIKLVLNLIHRFKNHEKQKEDLFQVGSIGLIKAIERFDTKKGVQFSTYAVPMILGEIKRYLRDNNSMKVSRSLKESGRKLLQFKEEFTKEHFREPEIIEIAEGMSKKKEEIVWIMEANQELLSLYKPINDDGEEEITIEDRLKEKTDWEENLIKSETIKEAFTHLNKNEKLVVNLRFFEDKTQSEIGKFLGVSQAHVSRIEKTALKKLRNVI